MKEFRERIESSSPFLKLLEEIFSEAPQPVKVHGISGSLLAFLLSFLSEATGKSILAIFPDAERAEVLKDDLEVILGRDKVSYFPAWDAPLSEGGRPGIDEVGLRIETLSLLASGSSGVTVATIQAAMQPTVPPDIFKEAVTEIKPGSDIKFGSFLSKLAENGFERVNMVETVGQMSVRGGIVDIYSFGSENPVRVEFFGDVVDSIREFDITSQRSVKHLERALVLPRSEAILREDIVERALRDLPISEDSGQLRDMLSMMDFSKGLEFYLPAIYGSISGLADHFSPGSILFLIEPDEVEEAGIRAEEDFGKTYLARCPDLSFSSIFPKFSEIANSFSKFRSVEDFAIAPAEGEYIEFGSMSGRQFERNLKVLNEDLERLAKQGYDIVILCDNSGQSERLRDLLEENPFWDDISARISIEVGGLHSGFTFPEALAVLINDHEIFSRYRRRYRYRKFKIGIPLPSLDALSPGDYIVHEDHGIGRYLGLKTIAVDSVKKECLNIEYQDRDRLYIPIENLNSVQKYSSEGVQVPVLSKIGGAAWEKLKSRTRKGIFKMARELVELYAERNARPGYTFSADTEWQRELEASFIYEETPDQLKATEEVKRDLESASPMDRLICGDVGYGKTEVSIRAAFKVMTEGKQVAVLVPTTVLAEQHYRTFSERLADFPVTVEMLSRFRTTSEQKKVIEGLSNGTVDMVIGTHRLLSKDVRMKDLGLVVIDEEQRFGVSHKEKLKKLRRQVDAITMTATPIPRTLNMSLMGVRDMSTIATPPKYRLPIRTEIIPFDEDRIAEAVLREIDRGGQVYFVHNRVQTIDSMAEFLKELLPQVRFVVAHGQMPEKHLERVIIDFMDGKYDCLVSTMIIESGIDIPNVNTIIIDRADTLGLSQLYQIRGRVGRSNRQAFAYLLTPKDRKTTPEARKRLRAIEEFTELGSGFKVAMRDLEIRGAGNILGKEQHGFIVAVGFDLYCKLLKEAIAEIKGEAPSGPEPKVEVKVSAYFPDDYIPDETQRVSFYRRIARAEKYLEVWEIEQELFDRYGRIPPCGKALIEAAYLRIASKRAGLSELYLSGGKMKLTFHPEKELSREYIWELVRRTALQIGFSFAEKAAVEVNLEGRNETERLECARNFLQAIS